MDYNLLRCISKNDNSYVYYDSAGFYTGRHSWHRRGTTPLFSLQASHVEGFQRQSIDVEVLWGW